MYDKLDKENGLTSADRCNSSESTASSMSSTSIPVEVPNPTDLSISYSVDKTGLVEKVTFSENHFGSTENGVLLHAPEVQLKSSSLPHGSKLCLEADLIKDGDSCSNVSDGESDKSRGDLEEELRRAHTEIKAKDAEMEVLKGIRTQVEGELTDLTAALFEEANKMVQAAKLKEATSEKNLKETRMQLEGLQAEVAALKTLLITSTPSRPNLGGGNGISLFKKQHQRCMSQNHIHCGKGEDEVDSKRSSQNPNEVNIDREACEIDPTMLTQFAQWRQEPVVTCENPPAGFLERVITEDVNPCLYFANEDLAARLRAAIEENSVWVEPIPEKDKRISPTECTLLLRPRICHYRMRFANDSEWYDISKICRDRVAAVCEFLNYLRYMKNGVSKASTDDAYWEVIRLRKQMALAKLGIPIS